MSLISNTTVLSNFSRIDQLRFQSCPSLACLGSRSAKKLRSVALANAAGTLAIGTTIDTRNAAGPLSAFAGAAGTAGAEFEGRAATNPTISGHRAIVMATAATAPGAQRPATDGGAIPADGGCRTRARCAAGSRWDLLHGIVDGLVLTGVGGVLESYHGWVLGNVDVIKCLGHQGKGHAEDQNR